MRDSFGSVDESRSPGRIPCGGTAAGAEEEEEGGAAGAAAGIRAEELIPGERHAERRPQDDVKMRLLLGLLLLITGLQGGHGQGVYGKDGTTGHTHRTHTGNIPGTHR